MNAALHQIATNIVHLPLIALLIWIVYRRFWQRRAASSASDAPFKAWRLIALLGLAAMLAGCSNSDPLVVASGPVFQLNPGYWQPSKTALAAPPIVAAD